MDFDIEMEDAAGAYAGEAPLPPPAGDDDLLAEAGEIATGEAQEPGEIDEVAEAAQADRTLVPHKVHLRGLDTMTPDDVQAYVREHVGAAGTANTYDRIEWIDDSSANLVFASETAAAAAVTALCAMPIDDATQLPVGELLPARPYTARVLAAQAAAQAAPGRETDTAPPAPTGLPLQVRFAVASDKKLVGAAARSRFYLLHPEYDPEERQRFRNRRRDDRGGRGRDRDRERDRDRDYRARYRSNREDDDRREEDIRNNSFDVNLYDDDEAALAKRASRAAPGGNGGGRRRRGRSRSSWSQSSRSRSESRQRHRRHNNADKELFGGGVGGGGGGGRSKELFPDKMGGAGSEAGTGTGSGTGRRGSGSGSGRQQRNRSASPMRDYDDKNRDGRLADARAVAASEAASRNRDKARAIKDRLSTAPGNNSRDLFGDQATMGMAQMDLLGTSALSSRLSDRITRPSNGRGAAVATGGEGEDEDVGNGGNGGSSTFNIRGMAAQQTGQGPGLSIKGAATARELFPDRFGSADSGSGGGRNAGKEVFSDRLENRVRRRQRAEDLFH